MKPGAGKLEVNEEDTEPGHWTDRSGTHRDADRSRKGKPAGRKQSRCGMRIGTGTMNYSWRVICGAEHKRQSSNEHRNTRSLNTHRLDCTENRELNMNSTRRDSYLEAFVFAIGSYEGYNIEFFPQVFQICRWCMTK